MGRTFGDHEVASRVDETVGERNGLCGVVSKGGNDEE